MTDLAELSTGREQMIPGRVETPCPFNGKLGFKYAGTKVNKGTLKFGSACAI